MVKGHVEIHKQIEAVDAVVSELKADIARLEGDRRHFALSLVDAMNEVTSLRNKYVDFGEWEGEEYDEDEVEGDGLGNWYQDETGSRDAGGIGDLGYKERFRRSAAPLKGSLTKPGVLLETPDPISAARKAAQVAVVAASEQTQNTKAYEKLSGPEFP